MRIKKNNNIMKVGLFIPCYVDALFPEVGVATYKLLRKLKIDVIYPEKQTCCGQPMANGGFEEMSLDLANHFEEKFKSFDYVVTPSVSCSSFIRHNYPTFMSHKCNTPHNTYELVEFLSDILHIKALPGKFEHKVSVHNSCHGVRVLGLSTPSENNLPVENKIVKLLNLKEGIKVCEPDRKDECCGFGGMFSAEEPYVSTAMGTDKINNHIDTGAEIITGADCSCLMHMQGIAKKKGYNIKFMHVAEILAANL